MNSIERVLVEYIAINARKGKKLALSQPNAIASDLKGGLVDFFQQIEDHAQRLLEEDDGGH